MDHITKTLAQVTYTCFDLIVDSVIGECPIHVTTASRTEYEAVAILGVPGAHDTKALAFGSKILSKKVQRKRS